MDMDIQDLFKKKNKEILITNLKYDLDKNIGSLFETITNIFNLEFEVAIKTLNTLLDDGNYTQYRSIVIDTVTESKINNYEYIDKLIQEKKNVLIDKIDHLEFEEDKMHEYYEIVFNTTKEIKEKMIINFTNSFNIIYKKLDDYMNSSLNSNRELTAPRIEDYIKNRFFEKLETKLHMEIMLRDNNLINKAKEVYLRYLDICSKTE